MRRFLAGIELDLELDVANTLELSSSVGPSMYRAFSGGSESWIYSLSKGEGE